MAHTIGKRNPLWTQGYGGNISEKTDGYLVIKPSGERLDQMRPEAKIANISLDKLPELFSIQSDEAYSQWIQVSSLKGEGLGRASMETGFHIGLDKKYVLHFHSIPALLMCQKLKSTMDLDFNSFGLKLVILSHLRPGLKLTEAVLKSNPADIYLLKNHGVIIQSDDPLILKRWEDTERDFLRHHYPELLDWYDKSTAEIVQSLGNMPAPMKIYFPDAAVFSAELKMFLGAQGQALNQIIDAETKYETFVERKDWKNLNLFEIWMATALLYRFSPELAEISNDESREIASLPAEAHRKRERS